MSDELTVPNLARILMRNAPGMGAFAARTVASGILTTISPEIERLREDRAEMAMEVARLREAAKGQLVIVNAAKDAIARAEKAEDALKTATEWRPIETAPRDGTLIIGAVFFTRWADNHREHDIARRWYQPEFDAFISSCREMVMAPGYMINGKTRELHSPVIEPVTHWLPLPAAPAEEAGQ